LLVLKGLESVYIKEGKQNIELLREILDRVNSHFAIAFISMETRRAETTEEFG